MAVSVGGLLHVGGVVTDGVGEGVAVPVGGSVYVGGVVTDGVKSCTKGSKVGL